MSAPEGFPINELALPGHLRTPALDRLRDDAITAWCMAHRWHMRAVEVNSAVTAQARYSMALAERFMWEHGGPRYTDGPREPRCQECGNVHLGPQPGKYASLTQRGPGVDFTGRDA